MGIFDSLSSLLGNPQAAAGAVAGPPQPTPTLQQNPGMSPSQIAMMRDYIKQLQKHNLEPVGPTGGMGQALAANLAKGLASGITGYSMYQAGENEKEALRQGAEAAVPNFGTPGSPSPGPPSMGGGIASSTDTAPTGGTTRSASADSGPADMSYGSTILPHDAAKAAIWNNEADERGYRTVGPTVPARGGHPSGNALGAYQVMSYDLPNRLAAAGLPPMNAAEFLRSPEAQEAQFKHEFTKLQQKYGNFNDAASAWHSGRPLDVATRQGATDGYMKTSDYVAKANRFLADKGYKPYGPGETGAVAPVAAAPIAPVAGANTAPPVPSRSVVPPPAAVGNLPTPAAPSAFDKPNQSMVSAIAGPQGVPPPSAVGADTVAALNKPGAGGAPAVMDYARGLSPTGAIVPPVMPQAKETANAIVPGTVPTPPGEAPLTNPQLTASTGGPQAPPELSQPGGMVLDKPIIPPESVPRRPMYSRDQMVRIMSNPYMDPAMKQQAYQSYLQQNQEIPVPYKGMGTVYIHPTTGAQRWVPDPIKSERKIGGISRQIIQFYNPKTNQLEEVPSGPPGGENGPTGGARPSPNLNSDEGMMRADVQHQSELAGGKATAEKRSEAYEKRRDSIMKRSQDVRDEIPQLQLLKRIIADPNYRSGLLSGRQADLDQIGKAIGVTSGKMAETYQLAKKLGSAASLQSVRMMGEIGAVRIPEMHMVEKSTYDPNNTPEVNNAVVEINLRSAMREQQVGEMARNYLRSHRALDDGFEQVVADRFKAEPLFNDKELGDFNTILDRGPGGQQGGAAASSGGPVQVSSPEDARKLPSGTRIILPDGSRGRVP